MSNTTTHTTTVRYDRITKDFAVNVDGKLVGFAPTILAGEQMAREHVARLIENELRCEAAEVAAPVAVEVAATAPQVAQPLATSAAIAATVAQARAKVATDRRWLAAVNKAADKLNTTRWQFDGRRLLVASATTAGQRYMVERGMCECTAAQNGRVCWHVAAYGLLTRASRHQAAA